MAGGSRTGVGVVSGSATTSTDPQSEIAFLVACMSQQRRCRERSRTIAVSDDGNDPRNASDKEWEAV